MRELAAELFFRLRAGPGATITWALDRLLDGSRDRSFGIATSSVNAPDTGSPDFVHYQPVSYRDLDESLALASVSRDDVFLDVGSGMGRAVCVAAMHPFRRVIGVEISSELCALARQNVARIRQKTVCGEVEIVNANALEYSIPRDTTLIFLFNPLSGAALRMLLERVGESYREHPRPLRLLFTGTLSSERFAREAMQHRFLRRIEDRTLSTGARALLYNVQDQA
ncbi:MAG TPA: class I SAM-dependent methyltransferase [Bryobacteraceae bacterium]|jgi:SAM-dependent methyltransferase|nr:class I SAM-dependent methyltransferase [Bryobacteraceae bacterium]